jgi:hypothetical protein
MRKVQKQQAVSQSSAAAQRRRRNGQDSAGLKSFQGNEGPGSAGVSLALNGASSVLAQRKIINSLQHSPHSIAQLEKTHGIQLKAGSKTLQEKADVSQRVEDEELMQGKFEAAQLMEEDELQGKFDSTQLMEEEELQGKFDSTQLMEEEELQGKFESTQLMEEEELQGKFETAQLMEEDELQGKFDTAQLKQDPGPVSENKTGLPDNLKSGIESLSGVSMDGVKVHYNSDKPAQLNAHAYAQGKNIHVASGQEKHLPHEAWHVVQQAQGRVKPTTEMNGGVKVNDDQSLETEADVQGAKALQQKAVTPRINSEK